MNHILETRRIHGFDVHILISHDAENPLEWGNATLLTAHRRYTFGGDKLPFDANSIEEAFDWHLAAKGLIRRDVIWLPVYLYDHSGLALSDTPFGDRWDSGQLGYIYETRSNIRAEYRVQRISRKLEQSVLARLRHTLQLLEYWANGNVYAYEIPALDEYCGGFYGWDHETSGLVEYATDAVETHLRLQRQKRYARLKQLLRDHVPLHLRPALLAAF